MKSATSDKMAVLGIMYKYGDADPFVKRVQDKIKDLVDNQGACYLQH